MPRYYLNVHNELGETRDEEGHELPDLDAARKEAILGVRSLLVEEAAKGRMDLRGWLDVTNATGEILLSVPFDKAIEIIQSRREAAQGPKLALLIRAKR
jgi:hypothetical protein